MSEASTSTGKRRAHTEPDGGESKSKKPQTTDHEQQGSNTKTMEGMPTKPEPEDVLRMDTTLTPILNHLNVIDLLSAYNVDKKFRLIVEDEIGQKKVSFDELRGRVSTAKVFKLFGKHMTNLQISEEDVENYPANAKYTDFDKLIKIITLYCSPDKLVELEMRFNNRMFGRHTESLLQRARPFFANVTKLILRKKNETGVQRFLSMFPSNNIQTLRMDCHITNGNWLNSSELQSLQHLYIPHHTDDESIDFTRFFELHPNLKSFYCRYNTRIELIARYVPSIENIGRLVNISREQIHCFGRFNRLKRLEIWVRNGCNLFETLENLPNKHILEVLAFGSCYYDYSNEAIVRRLPSIIGEFTHLKWLKINYLCASAETFLSIILPQLNAVTKCSVVRFRGVGHYVQLLRLLKNLRVLVVYGRIGPELYQDLMDAWKKRLQEESFSYPIVISFGSNYWYDRSMNDCQPVYDGNVVRFEKNVDEIEFFFDI